MPSSLIFLVTLILLSIPLIAYRLHVTFRFKQPKPRPLGRRNAKGSTHLLVVLGSGGHTAEMLAMLQRAVRETDSSKALDLRDYTYRTYVVGSGDKISAQRANDFEQLALNLVSGKSGRENTDKASSVIVTVPRAREIHQPLLTTPLSCLKCMLVCINALVQHGRTERDFPDIILCNGPATATIMVFASLMVRFLDVNGCERRDKMRTVYVESWARVKRLSLSGRLLVRVVDRFLVQWPQLEGVGGRAEFVGVLV